MTKDEAFHLFEIMIDEAEKELLSFTLHSGLSIEHKADKSAVTECDKSIDRKLSAIAKNNNLQVVSEEGALVKNIVESGNYITIDPIDGTLGYIEYVNYALKKGDIQSFIKEDLGAEHDFCLLLGIVEHGIPQYAACYNYITNEKILIDGSNKNNLQRENNKRNYSVPNAVYVDQRPGDKIEKELMTVEDSVVIKQATLGLKSLYTIINPHQNAITVHRVQVAGLWDIMPAAVAAHAFGGGVYDDLGNPLEFDKYIILPGKGATIIKNHKFDFVLDLLKGNPQNL